MQSAEEFAKFIADDRNGTLADKTALIRTRDREIVEACRKLLMDLHKAHGDLGTYDMNYVLDSVLRDLG